ncbi:MAG TPA: FKBP-type peptidyl-prolyl cis-trans isomerase [Paludibacteraceae bacterium]|nr:FKBP-type peptidyl-prolyl cis-trans isomerase [Paludibacteraceae bacterium]
MKKFILGVAALAAITMGFSSCNKAPKAELKSETDSLAYSYGMTTSRGLKEYLVRLEVDTTKNMDAFIKGFLKATKDMSDEEKAEMVGAQIGQQVMQQMMPHFESLVQDGDTTKVFNKNDYLAGFVAGVMDDSKVMTAEEAATYAETVQNRMVSEKAAAKYGDYRKANEAFLAENAKKAGVTTTASGLQYEVLKAGTGIKPTAASVVKVHYHGTLIDGTVFDSSVERKEPATFGVSEVIKGWTEALQLMPVGSKWRLYIPQELAYGPAEQGTIKPFSTLIFDVELISIER